MPANPPDAPRTRAVAVVVSGDSVLAIRRHRDGTGYWVLPGGGVEPGESFESACLRELAEETGLHGVIRRRLPSPTDAYFEVVASGEPILGGPERDRHHPQNSYEPAWVAAVQLCGDGTLVPDAARDALRSVLDDR